MVGLSWWPRWMRIRTAGELGGTVCASGASVGGVRDETRWVKQLLRVLAEDLALVGSGADSAVGARPTDGGHGNCSTVTPCSDAYRSASVRCASVNTRYPWTLPGVRTSNVRSVMGVRSRATQTG